MAYEEPHFAYNKRMLSSYHLHFKFRHFDEQSETDLLTQGVSKTPFKIRK